MNNKFHTPKKQKGIVLFIALIVLVSMTIGGVALMRSVDTSSIVSGNLSFKMASLRLSDIGIDAAVNQLASFTLPASRDVVSPVGCTTNCKYYPTILTVNTSASGGQTIGVPSQYNGVKIDWKNATIADGYSIPTGYTVRYIIDRLCQAIPTDDNFADNCLSGINTTGASQKSDSSQFAGRTNVYYRVTVRVEGPRSTLSYAQVILTLG